MKLTVNIDGQAFEVEVGDVRARPIVARIGAEQFEVWPEEVASSELRVQETQPVTRNLQPATHNPQPATRNARAVIAPLPGVIVSLAVEAGASVAVGQELCALEAMKMKNVIRAPRAGTIAAVRVTTGQTVKHKDVLLEYAE